MQLVVDKVIGGSGNAYDTEHLDVDGAWRPFIWGVSIALGGGHHLSLGDLVFYVGML